MKLIAAFALMFAVAASNLSANSDEQQLKALLKRAQQLRDQRNLVEQNVFLSPDKRRVEELKLINEEKDVLSTAIALKKKMEASGR